MPAIPTTQIKSYHEFAGHMGGSPNTALFYYRGIPSGYDLYATINYDDNIRKHIKDFSDYQRCTVSQFAEQVNKFYPDKPKAVDDWMLWVVARHCGLKSRLSDFTIKASVAFEMAIRKANGNNIRIYCLHREALPHIRMEQLEAASTSPFSFDQICLIQPYTRQDENEAFYAAMRRIRVQSGKFLHQPLSTIATPLTDLIPEKFWLVFELNNAYHHAVMEEIAELEQIDMSKSLMMDKNPLDAISEAINEQCAGI